MNYGFGPFGAGGGLSIMRVLGSLSRTLGVVRQISPLYRDLKPILKKAPQFFARINGLRGNMRDVQENLSRPMLDQQKEFLSRENYSGGPVFFQ